LYFSQINVASVKPIDCSERVNLIRVCLFSLHVALKCGQVLTIVAACTESALCLANV
jgi:transcriptional antiterminator Rof (Rho-off)